MANACCVKPRRRSACVSASLSEREAEYYSQRPPTPLLDTINYPVHMKNLSVKELRQLADELRSDVIFHVSKTGGHLGSSLGVVELTVALHNVFNAPQDRILWDVGHQVRHGNGCRARGGAPLWVTCAPCERAGQVADRSRLTIDPAVCLFMMTVAVVPAQDPDGAAR